MSHNSQTFLLFQPGESKIVKLVKIGGKQVIRGGNGLVDGPVNDKEKLTLAMEAVTKRGFGNIEESNARFLFSLFILFIFLSQWNKCQLLALMFCSEGVTGKDDSLTTRITREGYANMYGPTTGDKIQLGDTNLIAEIEYDGACYGDECVFGGGKVIREGMGQACGCEPALDTVITNAVIIDYTGVYKADIGIKDGLICAIGKAGNPDTMENVFSDMIIGVSRMLK